MKIQNKPFIYSKPVTQCNPPAKPGNLREENLHIHKIAFTRPLLSFKGKQITVDTKSGSPTIFHKIKPELGEEPIFFWGKGSENKVVQPYVTKKFNIDANYSAPYAQHEYDERFSGKREMFGAGNFDNIYYAIYYKDTGKWDDNNKKGYVIHPKKLAEKAVVIDKKTTKQPLVNILSKGTAQGKLIFEETLQDVIKKTKNKNEPIIAVIKNYKDSELHTNIPENIKGILFIRESIGALSHEAATFRYHKIASASVFDDKKIAELKKREGKKIELKAFVNDIKAKEIDKITAQDVKKKKITIPKLKIAHNSKPLISSEYESHLVGTKAYNLRRLEEANIPNIIVPKSFALPPGFFHKILKDPANSKAKKEIEKQEQLLEKLGNNPEKHEEIIVALVKINHFTRKCKFNPIYEKQINDCVKKHLGISDFEKKDLIARSAFSGEDVKGYSAAGLYRSIETGNNIPLGLKYVWISKWYEAPYYSRLDHQIPHKAVQPTVIVQKYIPADYTFTIYTNDVRNNNPDKIFIEMSNKKAIDPYIITYDKKTKEIEVESKIRKSRELAFDENMNFLEKDSEKQPDPIGEDKKLWIPLLKKVGEAASQIEKEFGAPQDIEGGIILGLPKQKRFSDRGELQKAEESATSENRNVNSSPTDYKNPKIYVWQTRDIEL